MTQPSLFNIPPTVYHLHRAEVQAEQQRTDGSKEKILARLRLGPAMNYELAQIALRYTGRLSDARIHDGATITKEHLGGGLWEYTLVSERTKNGGDDDD